MGISRIRTTDEQKQLLARQIATSIARGRRVESQGDFQAVLLRGRRVNHLLHLILTLLTFWLMGGWAWGLDRTGDLRRREEGNRDGGRVRQRHPLQSVKTGSTEQGRPRRSLKQQPTKRDDERTRPATAGSSSFHTPTL